MSVLNTSSSRVWQAMTPTWRVLRTAGTTPKTVRFRVEWSCPGCNGDAEDSELAALLAAAFGPGGPESSVAESAW
jgi:hypothetical protein